MTKKIGIITINDFSNYGNRLQCYAVQHYLEGMGYTVENVYNTYKRTGFLATSVKKIIRLVKYFRYMANIAGREKSFAAFNQNIRFSPERILRGRFSQKLNEEYDYFIAGSDQIWNPFYTGGVETKFLHFASAEKRIAFSASMGVEMMPEQEAESYRQGLIKFHSISVREEAAKTIIEGLTGRKDVEVLVDPTMLLTKSEWEQLAQKPELPYGSRYILVYFLGGAGKRAALIEGMAERYSCEVIDIYDMGSVFYTCGPQHFLELEKNAFLVCTDSFHAAVFAFLFDRPFIVFDRENTKFSMNSRLDTFLSKFALQNQAYVKGKDWNQYLDYDYSEGYRVLEQEREKARRFLTRALS